MSEHQEQMVLRKMLLIGGAQHGKTDMIGDGVMERWLFPERKSVMDPLPVAERYVREQFSFLDDDGSAHRREFFRIADADPGDIMAGLIDVIMTAWCKGEIDVG